MRLSAETSERQRVVIRVDAGPAIGLGHLLRMRSLAEGLIRQGATVEVVGRDIVSVESADPSFSVKGFDGPLADESEDLARTISLIGEGAPDLVVVDHYGLGEAWERGIAERFPVATIVAVDDLPDRPHAVDVLVDPNLGASGPRPAVSASGRTFIGPAYAPLAAEYREPVEERPSDASHPRVLVTLGGGRSGVVGPLAEAIVDDRRLRHVAFEFVVPDPTECAAVTLALEGRADCIVHGRVPTLRPLLERADLVVGAGGTSAWQRLRLGRPSVMLTLADNQIRTAEALRDLDLARWVEEGTDPRSVADAVVDALEDEALRLRARAHGPLLVDGRGVDRIVLALLRPSAPPTLRLLEDGDAAALLAMANDPVTRAASRNTRSIRPDEHLAWFGRTREAMGRTSWVAERDGLVVGQVRFSPLGDDWELHYELDPAARGRGWSSPMVAEGLRRLAATGATGDVHAAVHRMNEASRRSLAALGFVPDDPGAAAAAGVRLPDGFDAYVRAGEPAPR